MSKIEQFQAAKQLLAQSEAILDKWNDSHWDKVGGTVSLSKTYAGYYGSSSTHSWVDGVQKLVQDELRRLLGQAIRNAVDTARIRLKRSRLDAEAEAKEILQQTDDK